MVSIDNDFDGFLDFLQKTCDVVKPQQYKSNFVEEEGLLLNLNGWKKVCPKCFKEIKNHDVKECLNAGREKMYKMQK